MKKKIQMFLIMVCFLFTSIIPIYATTINVDELMNIYVSVDDIDAHIAYLHADKKLVYCIDPTKLVYDGTDASESSKLSNSMRNKISIISECGYNTTNRKSDKWYAATQIYIWKTLGYSLSVHNFSDYSTYEDAIEKRVNSFSTLPSFAKEKITLKKGQTVTLKDTNGVLSDYAVLLNSGSASVSRSGNTLTISNTSNKASSGTITLKRVAESGIGSAVVYGNSNGVQETIYPLITSNITTTLTYRIESYGKIQFIKKGEMPTTPFISESAYGNVYTLQYQESELKGVKANIYAREDILDVWGNVVYKKDALVDTLISGSDTISKELVSGNYYVKEIETKDGYILDSNEYDITIKDSDTNILNYNIEMNNIRKKVNINFNKQLEEDKNHTINEAYKDVVFGIYANEDLKDYDGNILVNKDNLVYISNIDENGNLIEPLDLMIGSYYLKELQTNNHYVLDTNNYYFNVENNEEDTINININESSLENCLIKHDVNIYKVDDTKRPLQATFTLYDENMNEILTFETVDGMYTIKDLCDGIYYLKEIKAPEGYILDSTLYTLDTSKTLEYTYTNEKEAEVIINEPSVDTGDTSKNYEIPLFISILGIGLLIIKKLYKRFM